MSRSYQKTNYQIKIMKDLDFITIICIRLLAFLETIRSVCCCWTVGLDLTADVHNVSVWTERSSAAQTEPLSYLICLCVRSNVSGGCLADWKKTTLLFL